MAAECLRRGVWDGLEAPQLAAALSALVYESRNPDDADPPRVPGGPVKPVLAEMVSIWSSSTRVEREHRLSFLREPDLGFAWAAYRWAGGAALDDVLDDVDLAPGDFVRWVKQVLDLAEQIADAAGPDPSAKRRAKPSGRSGAASSRWRETSTPTRRTAKRLDLSSRSCERVPVCRQTLALTARRGVWLALLVEGSGVGWGP